MMKNILRNILFVCLLAIPAGAFAQIVAHGEQRPPDNMLPINRYELLDKVWYFVASKCPDKVGTESHYIHYISTLQLTASNSNNINYGTYTRYNRDMSDNPNERGTYALNTDEVGNLVLTLRNRMGDKSVYMVPMVETNHLTLIRTDGGDKCNISYAVAP